MNTPEIREAGEFKRWYIFFGGGEGRYFWNFRRDLSFRGRDYLLLGTWPISYSISNYILFYFLVFIFLKDLIKILYFLKKSLFFCDSCFHATAQKCILLGYVILLHTRVLIMTLKRHCFHFWLVRFTWGRQMLVTKSNKYTRVISIVYYFSLFETKNCSEGTLCTYPSQ